MVDVRRETILQIHETTVDRGPGFGSQILVTPDVSTSRHPASTSVLYVGDGKPQRLKTSYLYNPHTGYQRKRQVLHQHSSV